MGENRVRLSPERILGSLAGSSEHNARALWLLLRVVKAGGEAVWDELVDEYAKARGWERETARKRLEDSYLLLQRKGILRKRRKSFFIRGKKKVYVELTPSARALLLHICS